MSFINRLFGKVFGNSNNKDQRSPASLPNESPEKRDVPSTNNDRQEAPPVNYLSRWEKERQERLKAAEVKLKSWIIDAVKKKGSLPFTWESGHDEAFVTFKDRDESEEKIFWDLEAYMIDKLEIPDAGEFKMNGSAMIYIVDDIVKVRFSSTMNELLDYNEETDEEVYGESVLDSGVVELFPV